ncbi:MAG: hypothetical protein Q7K33_01060 [Candidatus Berkelbacteria bacterium]|nr:hypothetical protein [Candidatus Berkelbacteria bacterium]
MVATLLVGCGSSNTVPPTARLFATDTAGSELATRLIDGNISYISPPDQWIHFALPTNRGGVSPGEEVVWVFHEGDDILADFERSHDDPFMIVVNEVGAYRAEMWIGLTDGSRRVEGTCSLKIE